MYVVLMIFCCSFRVKQRGFACITVRTAPPSCRGALLSASAKAYKPHRERGRDANPSLCFFYILFTNLSNIFSVSISLSPKSDLSKITAIGYTWEFFSILNIETILSLASSVLPVFPPINGL